MCKHGYIGACAICDGSGQMPEPEFNTKLGVWDDEIWSDVLDEIELEDFPDDFPLYLEYPEEDMDESFPIG